MSPDREVVRFAREKRGRYRPAQGAWETVLLMARDVIPERRFGGTEADSYWVEIEEKAKMTLNGACFQYYLSGIGHRTLAETVVNSFPSVRTAVGLDPSASDWRDNAVNQIADKIYPNYPKEYRKKVKR